MHLARGWLGLRLARNWSLGARNEAFRRATLAVTGDVWHEALAENAMTLAAFDGSNPETFRSDMAGTWGELDHRTFNRVHILLF